MANPAVLTSKNLESDFLKSGEFQNQTLGADNGSDCVAKLN